MLAALSRVVKKDIVKVFSLTALSTLVRMLTGFLSIKIVAALIGPSGIALLGQLNNFSSIFLTLSTGGINSGVTKHVAEYVGSRQKIALFLRTAFWITAVMSVTAGIILFFGAEVFSEMVLHDKKYASIIRIFGLTIVFYAFNNLLLSVLNGYKEFKKYVTVGIVGSFVGLLFTAVLAWNFKVYGALLSAVTFQSVIFLVTFYIIFKSPSFRFRDYIGRFSNTAAKKLAHYSLMALVNAAVVPVSQIMVRGFIAKNLSLNDAGIWEGMNRISQMYLLIITSSLAVYYLPRLAEIKIRSELRAEIYSTYKVILPPLMLLSIAIYYARNLIVEIAFDERFQVMESLFGFQLVGDYFKIASWILAYQMMAKSMTMTFISTEVIFCSTYVILSMLFIGWYGITGATLAYAINYSLYLITIAFIFRKILIR